MVDKWTYKVFKDKVIYEPVAGVTVDEAITNAIDIAKYENKYVELLMNDVLLEVTANTSISYLRTKYLLKLDEKYKITLSSYKKENVK